MANALAIAGVTAVLRDLLDDGLVNANIDSLGAVEITARPPDAVIGDEERNRLNIYPWKVMHNLAFRNECLPSHNGGGTRTQSPRLALDLYYVMTATGAADLNAELLLGYGMQVLHEHPGLSPDEIRTSLQANPNPLNNAILPAAQRLLEASDLADQVERLRISSVPANDEELGKIWPAFNVALRMSAFYRISVVLIEKERTIIPGPPVREAQLGVSTLLRPTLSRIVAQQGGPTGPLRPGTQLQAGDRAAIIGSGLQSDNTVLRLGAAEIANPGGSMQQLSEIIPAGQAPGIHMVVVEHRRARNGEPDLVFESSNAMLMLVAPTVSQLAVAGAESNQTIDGTPRAVLNGTATATITNDIDESQSARLHLKPVDDTLPRRAFARETVANATDTLVFNLTDLIVGDYEWQLEVDGAETAPDTMRFEAP